MTFAQPGISMGKGKPRLCRACANELLPSRVNPIVYCPKCDALLIVLAPEQEPA